MYYNIIKSIKICLIADVLESENQKNLEINRISINKNKFNKEKNC
jgi:hypothetical protein